MCGDCVNPKLADFSKRDSSGRPGAVFRLFERILFWPSAEARSTGSGFALSDAEGTLVPSSAGCPDVRDPQRAVVGCWAGDWPTSGPLLRRCSKCTNHCRPLSSGLASSDTEEAICDSTAAGCDLGVMCGQPQYSALFY